MVRPQELWGRRSVAIGVVLVVLAVIGGIVLLATSGGGGSSTSTTRNAGLAALQDKLLSRTVVVPAKGIQVRLPSTWTATKQRDVIRVRSQDSCLVMTLAAPTDAKGAQGLMQNSVKFLRQTYKNVSVRAARTAAPIGGIPTSTNAVTLKDSKGNQRSILVSVGTGKKYAYLTNVTAAPTCTADLVVGHVVLSSVQYTK